MHWFWKLTDGLTPDQQILCLVLLKPLALGALIIGAMIGAAIFLST